MIREVLASIVVARNSRQHVSIIMLSLVLVVAAFLISCVDNPFIDETSNDNAGTDAIGKIVMHQTGGFAGVSRMITIREEGGSIVLVSVDQDVNKSGISLVMPEDLDQLWQTLEANDIFTLPTNQKLLETVQDGFFFEVTVHRGERYNRFSVYTPDLLVERGELRYDAITQSIQRFADSQLQEEFIIADMPISNVSVQILESFPLQIHILVNGVLSDGCTTLNEITQQREGNTIRVHITTKRPKDAMCAQVITEITERIPLEGTFLPGRYKVIVNDFEKDFEI